MKTILDQANEQRIKAKQMSFHQTAHDFVTAEFDLTKLIY